MEIQFHSGEGGCGGSQMRHQTTAGSFTQTLK